MGARRIAEISGYDRIITFDMGGTSTDVSLCDKAIQLNTVFLEESDLLEVNQYSNFVINVNANGF